MLDQAGRDAQPRGDGWDTLPARLAALPQASGWRIHRLAAVVGVAAMIAAAIGLALYLGHGPAAVAAPAPIEVVPQDVEVTIFNETETPGYPLFTPTAPSSQDQRDDAIAQRRIARRNMPVQQPAQQLEFAWHGPTVRTGMALVKDHRLVLNLQPGDNVVRFTDVAATIDPTSVRFVSDTDPLGTTVVEQNFEYDLATAAALLRRYLDKKVVCIGKDGAETAGYLCSYDDGGIVLADDMPRKDGGDRKTQTVSRDDVRAVRLAEAPKDLFVKPTLVWKLRTKRPGRHDTTLAYVCGEMKWAADYVGVVTPGDREQGDRLDVQGWVTIENRSGSTYRDARLKVIAGDVNRVVDPWAPVLKYPEAQERFLFGVGGAAILARPSMQFAEKSFFDYHLYTLSAPSTIRDQQIKQLRLLKADGVRAKRRYFLGVAYGSHAQIRLEFKNEKDNHLGMPLPKGRFRLMQRDADGELAFIGQQGLDHTPVDEEMTVTIGSAFDVVGERTVVGTRTPAPHHRLTTIRFRVRNHKDEAIDVRFVESLADNLNWTIPETTDPWVKEKSNVIHFDFTLEPNAEKTITFTVEYQW